MIISYITSTYFSYNIYVNIKNISHNKQDISFLSRYMYLCQYCLSHVDVYMGTCMHHVVLLVGTDERLPKVNIMRLFARRFF